MIVKMKFSAWIEKVLKSKEEPSFLGSSLSIRHLPAASDSAEVMTVFSA